MPRRINLKEIVRKNPQIDLEEIRAWTQLRKTLAESGLVSRRKQGCGHPDDVRARIADEAEDDPRLIRLSR